MGARGPAIVRFCQRVNKTESCWLWMGKVYPSKHNMGYGKFWNYDRTVQVHRFSYELFVGPIPAGLTIDHLCRKPICVNPAHLEPVTLKENILRGNGAAALNSRKTQCKNGHPFTRIVGGKRSCEQCYKDRVKRKNAAYYKLHIEVERTRRSRTRSQQRKRHDARS